MGLFHGSPLTLPYKLKVKISWYVHRRFPHSIGVLSLLHWGLSNLSAKLHMQVPKSRIHPRFHIETKLAIPG